MIKPSNAFLAETKYLSKWTLRIIICFLSLNHRKCVCLVTSLVPKKTWPLLHDLWVNFNKQYIYLKMNLNQKFVFIDWGMCFSFVALQTANKIVNPRNSPNRKLHQQNVRPFVMFLLYMLTWLQISKNLTEPGSDLTFFELF